MGKTALRHTVGEWVNVRLWQRVIEGVIVDIGLSAAGTLMYWIELMDGTAIVTTANDSVIVEVTREGQP